MAEQHVKNTKYKYDLNASLVVAQKHHHQGDDAAKAGDGTGESLVGRISTKFGDRAAFSKPDELKEKAAKKLISKGGPKQAANFLADQDVLNVQISSEELLYRPKTRDSRAAYDQMLQIVMRHMGDQTLETIQGALDEIIAILKSELRDSERRSEIESLIDRLSDADFNSLVVFGQCLSDYQVKQKEDNNCEMEEVQVDPEMNFSQSDESDFEDVYHVKENAEQITGLNEESGEETQQIDTNKVITAPSDQLQITDIKDAWLYKQLDGAFQNSKSADEVTKLEQQIIDLLGQESISQRDCEKKLLSLVGHQRFTLVRTLIRSRNVVYWGTLLDQAKDDHEKVYSKMMQSDTGRLLLKQDKAEETPIKDISLALKQQVLETQLTATPWLNQKVVDLSSLKFQEGGRLMSNKKCHLPRGSTKLEKQGYDEIYVPALRHVPKSDERLIPLSEMPEWTNKAFPEGMTKLNTIQSRLYDRAFGSSENLLVCAPTGAGKTNIAMLAILQCLNSRRRANNTIDIKSFKIVYIAPMKALVSEIVGNFQRKLEHYEIQVRELTGDTHLTRQQIDDTQIIVTTPEKWDIITRKQGERAYLDLVKLLIVDEVHLLHDSRGPVLEAIIARLIRQIEQTSEMVRIVALSATLPNYLDVAAFLRVRETGVFYFDNTYRPVPLEQIYVGINERKAIKRMILMNEILYEKVMERAGKHQILIFVHSRKETSRTAKVIRDMALQQDQLSKFLKEDSASKEMLLTQVDKCDSQELKDILPFGIGMHHAGMTKRDRKMVEDLFAAGYLQVLCSTATLAWGVNLPAHTVILKGTQIYSPEKGKWIELSPQDVLQMMGRAGRPQYDTVGEGIILTTQTEMQYYLSLNNMQLPIESQMIASLADQLSAEIVLGTISNVKEAVNWLAYTYLYVRMLRNPQLYGINLHSTHGDPTLIARRQELVHAAALLLQKSHMVKYDKVSGSLSSTAIGKIAAFYYINHESMQVYCDNIKPHMNMIDIFRLFSLSREFAFIPIRENEKLELQKFIEKVPIPIKGTLDEPSTKVNILLQSYISRFKLEGYDINSDMVYVSQSAGRLMRALFEICLKKGWAQISEVLLNLCKMCEKRIWSSMSPLRQFALMPNMDEISRKIEKKAQFQWHHFYDMTAQQLGEIVNMPKQGKTILSYIHKFPRLELEAYVQPLTRTMLRVELDVKTHQSFTWDSKYHGTAEPFWILVHDCDNENILHSEQFILKQSQAGEEHRVSFTVPLHDPMPPHYFIKVISDRWMQAETSLPISFKHLLLPDKFLAPTQLQDMYPRQVRDLKFDEVEQLYRQDGTTEFNPIVTMVFEKLYQSNESMFVGAPTDLLTCAELAIFRELQQPESGKCLYLAPNDLICQNVCKIWTKKLEETLGLNIYTLDASQTFQQQAALMASADIIISTPTEWEIVSRRWRVRKVVQQVTLCIFDYIQMLDYSYEIAISRMRQIQQELKEVVLPGRSSPKQIRILGLACPVANAKDLAQWLGVQTDADRGNFFNFSPSVRPQPMEVSVLQFEQFNRTTRLLAMAKPAFNQVKKQLKLSEQAQAIVFVSDRKQARLTALDFVTFAAADEKSKEFLSSEIDEKIVDSLSEQTLKSCLEFGIGIVHDGLSEREINLIKQLYKDNKIRVMIIAQAQCWNIADLKAHIVVLLDLERYDGSERRFVEYSVPSVLYMQSLASQVLPSKQAPKCLLMVFAPRKDYFVKFLQEPLPIESQLSDNLHDILNAEIGVGSIKTKQEAVDWLTWTFMFRRLSPNPNYYNLSGRSPQNINDFLSQLIEDTIEDLQVAKCILVDEQTELDLTPANLGRIAAFYNVKYQTIAVFTKHLEDEQFLSRKLKGLLLVLCQSAEFAQTMSIRDGDGAILAHLSNLCNYPITQDSELNTVANKTNILLQCHFDRRPLPADLRLDQKALLQNALNLVHAMVDVISTNGYLNATLNCMELSQMIVQAMWASKSPLMQLPGFDQEIIFRLKNEQKIDEITDFMNMEDEIREKLLGVTPEQMQVLATICNRYPIVEMSYNISQSECDVVLDVTISRDEDEEEGLAVFNEPVYAQYYPKRRFEEWWIVVGQTSTGKLLAIKKITTFRAQQNASAQLKFSLATGDYIKDGYSIAELKLYLICDSYVGCDLQESIKVKLSI